MVHNYAPVICIHGPPPTGMGRDNDFSLFRALVKALPCGDKLMVTTLLLDPPYTTENLTDVRALNVKHPAIPRHCGDNQIVIAQLFLGYFGRWGGGGGLWIQMTGALHVYGNARTVSNSNNQSGNGNPNNAMVIIHAKFKLGWLQESDSTFKMLTFQFPVF